MILRRNSIVCFVILLPLICSPLRAEEAKLLASLDGVLLDVPGVGSVLRTEKKDIRLTAKESYRANTLKDKRLRNRQVRLEGMMRPDGRFEVEQLYTVRDGKPYKPRYFCELCNIVALEPGDCACCQQPTELQEIPVTETNK